MRFLAINFGGLGDEVLFLPCLKSIRLAHPDWHISLLVEPRARSIADLTDTIDDVLAFDIKKKPLTIKDKLELLSMLRRGKFDVVLSSGSSASVSMLLFASGIPKRVGYKGSSVSKLLLTDPVVLKREQYAGWMYHDLARGLGIDKEPFAPEVQVKPEAVERMRTLLGEPFFQSNDKPLVVAHPGTSKMALSKGLIKTWDPSRWKELILRFVSGGSRVILAGGPDDDEVIVEITKELEGENMPQGSFTCAYGKTRSVADLAALLSAANLVICVDSAPMHIAAGLAVPMVALFGPTDPARLLLTDEFKIALRDPGVSSEGYADGINYSVRGVQIPVDTVFRTATDLLKQASARGSSRESRLP